MLHRNQWKPFVFVCYLGKNLGYLPFSSKNDPVNPLTAFIYSCVPAPGGKYILFEILLIIFVLSLFINKYCVKPAESDYRNGHSKGDP